MKFMAVAGVLIMTGVAGALSAGVSASEEPVRSRIVTADGAARLMVNGKVIPPSMLFVNLHDRPNEENTRLMTGEIADAARYGVDLVTFTVGMPWAKPGEKVDYQAEVDHWIDVALKANPRALLIPRINPTFPPQWWQNAHPTEMTRFNDGSISGSPSPHSLLWRQDAAAQVSAMVVHLEKKYGSRIAGYHLSGHNTGEWFSEKHHHGMLSSTEECVIPAFRLFLTAKYGNDKILSQSWGRECKLAEVLPPTVEERLRKGPPVFRSLPAERNVVDFLEFRNREMAQAMLAVTGAAKAAAPEKVVLAFYGYHHELPCGAGLQESGHLAQELVLASPAVDILCSPVSYFDRMAGGVGPFMTPTDSAALHGKMRFLEDDLRTHLSPADSVEMRINGHRSAVDRHETEGILTRNAGMAITHSAGWWWMDLWGEGWYRGDEMWKFLAKLRDAQTQSNMVSAAPEIAVFVDGRSELLLRSSPNSQYPLLYKFRQDIGRIGAPVGYYVLDDLLTGKVAPARLNLFLDAYWLDADQLTGLRKALAARRDATAVWMWAPGIAGDGVTDFARGSACTGIKLEQLDASRGGGKITFNVGNKENYDATHGFLAPSFKVIDPSAQALAVYSDGSGTAVAAKNVDGFRSVYVGTLRLPSWFLRQLAEDAGVHIYNRQDEVVSAGYGFLMFHAVSDGDKVLSLPLECYLEDAVTGERLGPAREFKLNLKKGDSRLWRIK